MPSKWLFIRIQVITISKLIQKRIETENGAVVSTMSQTIFSSQIGLTGNDTVLFKWLTNLSYAKW